MIEDSYSSERASYFSAVPSFGQDKANRENANAGHRRAEGKCKLAEQSRAEQSRAEQSREQRMKVWRLCQWARQWAQAGKSQCRIPALARVLNRELWRGRSRLEVHERFLHFRVLESGCGCLELGQLGRLACNCQGSIEELVVRKF